MEHQGKEKQRAANIIWTTSSSYSFRPDFYEYDGTGKADLYWNCIIGAVHKHYDYPQLQSFFTHLKEDPDHVFYESLVWIGLENCAYEKEKNERLVLEDLRRSYALRVLRQEDAPSLYYLVDEIRQAHFRRVLGEELKMRDQVSHILSDLEFDVSMTTEQIVAAMEQLIAVHFPLHPAAHKKSLLKNIFSGSLNHRFNGNNVRGFNNPFRGAYLLRFFNMGSADLQEEHNQLKKRETRKKLTSRWQAIKDQWDKKQRETIQKYYGMAILTEAQTKALEQSVCAGNHRGCHLHFTRGEFGAGAAKVGGRDPKEIALNQREKNRQHYQRNLARNNNDIARLTHVIRNVMLVFLDPSTYRAKTGMLVAGRIWRNIYLHDSKVFLKHVLDDIGNLSVDILLDGSGSQIDRQEVIASQAYIIAESLTCCQIPVRVYSFCTNSVFTIINLFRDYGEVNKNDQIFNYRAAGCNRDGLAIRAALHWMGEARGEHKILIVLSDGKPLDPQGIPMRGNRIEPNFYADSLGVTDTALEVRKGRQEGISVLCVFTGVDEDLPAARKIYGSDLTRIQSVERFADSVGILMKNVLRNLSI